MGPIEPLCDEADMTLRADIAVRSRKAGVWDEACAFSSGVL